jgi:lipopolysaccharide biosynthesis glycosyltransferase
VISIIDSKLKFFALAIVSLLSLSILFFHPKNIKKTKNLRVVNQQQSDDFPEETPFENEKIINAFCFVSNENILQTSVTITSLLANTPKEVEVNFYLVHFLDKKITSENFDELKSIKGSIRNFNLELVSFSEEYIEKADIYGQDNEILVKLYAGELFPEIKRIIWICSGVVINEDITRFYQKDLRGRYLAGVDVFSHCKNPNNDGASSKFHLTSGVLLYNLREMRQNGIQVKFLQQAKKYSVCHQVEEQKKISRINVDEYVLSHALTRDKILILPCRYCVVPHLDVISKTYFKEEENEIKRSVAVYFSESCKPWRTKEGIRDFFYNIWRKYRKKLPGVKKETGIALFKEV